MEELNYIWATQGGDLASRLSAAYEFALIPIEPLEHRAEDSPVTTTILDLRPNLDARKSGGFIAYGDDAAAHPIGGIGGGPPPTNWLPVVLVAEDGKLSNSGTVANGAPSINVALAGPPDEQIALEVSWVRADESQDTQPPQIFTIATALIDHPDALNVLTLSNAADGDVATVLTRPVDADGQPHPAPPFANTLSLVVGGS